MRYLVLLFLISLTRMCFGFFDPFSVGCVVGLSVLGLNYNTVKDLTYCRFNECCNDYHIPAKLTELYHDLSYNLFGQHIVTNQLISALGAHLSRESKKPLVISFHGTPGTGKNYVADLIAKHIYKNGVKSQYVHKFLGRSDFPLESMSNHYKYVVNEKIREQLKKCPRSLFVFDEVDKMPPGIFESMTSLLDYHAQDYSKAIFIFLSNTAGVELSDQLSSLMNAGVRREDTKLHDFEKILEVGSYNLEGGLKQSSIIESHLIDHFMPFLPLEKKHIYQCIKAEFDRWHVRPQKEVVERIVNNFVVFDRKTGLFATSGCKTLEKKVAIEVKHYN